MDARPKPDRINTLALFALTSSGTDAFNHETPLRYVRTTSDFQTPHLTRPPRLGRNKPCFCGSGKKFKKCHMKK